MNLKKNNKGKRDLKSTIYKSINKLYTNQQNKNAREREIWVNTLKNYYYSPLLPFTMKGEASIYSWASPNPMV